MAEELAAPLTSQVLELFGPSSPGSPGALDNPDLLLGTVHRLAQENGRRVDFLQVSWYHALCLAAGGTFT
jgi:hypothetical protein